MRLFLCFAIFAGCDSNPEPPDLHQGGMITLTDCGYTVKTADGASRPQKATSFLGPDPTPRFIHVDTAGDPTKQMAILWRTNDETTMTTEVDFGENGATDQKKTGFTFVYDLGSGGTARMHETHLCNLKPDTEYTYKVGGNGVFSPTYKFRTAPDENGQITVAILGDTRDDYATWGMALHEAFQQAQPDLVMFSGDMVSLGPVQEDWDTWFTQAADLPNTALVVAHGNHEVNGVNFFSQFAMPGDEQNFEFNFGPMHLTVANDTPPDAATLASSVATTLGDNLAKGDSAPWNIVMNHKPIFSAAVSRHPEDSVTVRDAFQPVIDAHKVDVAFEGHDHNYERTLPMKGMTPGSGTTYIRLGSAGAPLDDVMTGAAWTAAIESGHSFGIARIRKGQLDFTAYRVDGSTIDTFTLTK